MYLLAKLGVNKSEIFQGQEDPIGTFDQLDLLKSLSASEIRNSIQQMTECPDYL